MTIAMLLAFAILIGALIVFILDVYPIDFVAFGIMALILLLGPVFNVKPEEAISGFSNPATITILAMFILSAGIYRTGLVNVLAQHMVRWAGRTELGQLFTIMLVVGPISAFINNTAAVAILMPSIVTMAKEYKRAPSKLLIPLSYFSQLAGAVTLVGTATNLLGSSLAEREGFGAFGMFEFSAIGLLIFLTGALYLLFIGRKILPDRRTTNDQIAERLDSKSYVAEFIVQPNCPIIGQTNWQSRLAEKYGIHVLEIIREAEHLEQPVSRCSIQSGDILFVTVNSQQLLNIKSLPGMAIAGEAQFRRNRKMQGDSPDFLEAVIGPTSELIGGTLKSTAFGHYYNCTVIAIRKHGAVLRDRLAEVALNFGDTLLLRGDQSALDKIKSDPSFIVTEEMQTEEFRREKIPVALVIICGVVLIAALGQPILVTAMVGCVLMVLTGCLKVNELHEAIRWDVIFLLAGIIPLGLVLQRTGGAQFIANLATLSAGYAPPLVVLGIFFLMTVILAEFISHSAAVVVMVPVGIATAQALGLDARAFVLASMFAASMSFSTPVGYQTNAMVYGPGGYRFLDFTKVGAPLSLLLAIATPIYIYLIWGI